MIEEITYEFGSVLVYDHYVIATMNEGISVKPEYNQILKDIANKHFQNKYFGYITHRINSYAVNPRIYFETSKIENLVGFAVVISSAQSATSVELEKTFLAKPFQAFNNLDDAKDWILDLISQHK